MKAKEIRDLSIEDMLAKIEEAQDQYTRTALNHAVTAIDSPAEIKKNRRLIARMITILREKELQELIK